ncbi:RDD family protein [Acidiferrimicrobium sp. IK]|uniref:RDD family protein n=1 Tax=Acidiferrimicrobium sp. IK TaxID=2871700 RepID=UPI0021CB5C9F|nr:RDD family protein [Acidiferrimicrobium sp. IK]MCU4184709.1 RDD family protein [Acidiferrimicrobium sp. IK]
MSWAGNSTPTPQLAGWWYRVGATVIDGIILGVVGGILGAAFGSVGARYALSFVLGLLYVSLLLAYRTQTVGMMALGTRCVDARTGMPISMGRAFGRTLVSDLLGITIIGGILDVLWPLWDPQNQTLHDKAVGSLVVMSREQVPNPPYPGGQPGTFGGSAPTPGGWGGSEPGWPSSPPPPAAPTPGGGWEQGGGWQTAAGPQTPAAPPGETGGWQTAPSSPPAPPAGPPPAPASQPAPQPAQSIPAAWYPDPAGSGQERWWDGKSWTEHLRASP